MSIDFLREKPQLNAGWNRIGILSDTHGYLHPSVFRLLESSEAILHAGDVTTDEILESLETVAPVHAIAGNCDGWDMGRTLRQKLAVAFPFGVIGLTHGHLQMCEDFDEALVESFASEKNLRLVVHGHTHVARCVDVKPRLRIVNPGSASQPRGGAPASLVLLDYAPDGNEDYVLHFVEIA